MIQDDFVPCPYQQNKPEDWEVDLIDMSES